MAEGDRLILATDRCSTCGGAGWTWWSTQPESPERGKWVVCRSCLGTGRNDQTGAKRQMPAHVPSEQPHDPAADSGHDQASAADVPNDAGRRSSGPDAAPERSD